MRDNSVTISKAIGIILMVLAHSGFSQYGDAFINMFHMPLFFFMSGYCFNDRHLQDPKNWLLKKVKGIYYPYVKFSLLFLFVHNLFYHLKIYKNSYTLHDYLFRGIRILVSMGCHDQLLGGYWFLSALFWGLIISFIFLKLFKNDVLKALLVVLSICFLMDSFHVLVPFLRINHMHFFASSFILAGVLYKRKEYKWETKPQVIIPIALLFILIGTEFWRGSVASLDYWKIPLYFATAILGTLAVFAIAKVICNYPFSSLFMSIGNNTLSILTWHFLCFKLASLIIIMMYVLPIDRLSDFPIIKEYAYRGWWALYFVLGIGLPMVIKHMTRTLYRPNSIM